MLLASNSSATSDVVTLTSLGGGTLGIGNLTGFYGAASGTSLGEGCVVVLLKRLEDAEASGDRVLCGTPCERWMDPAMPVTYRKEKSSVDVPDLRRHPESNRLQIDPNDLPIDATIAASEYRVRPYRRGGVQVRFPVADRGGVVVHLMREANQPVPAGAQVSVGARKFVVAAEGAVFISGQHGTVALEASWPGHRCRADIVIPAGSELPDLGAVSCKEAL